MGGIAQKKQMRLAGAGKLEPVQRIHNNYFNKEAA